MQCVLLHSRMLKDNVLHEGLILLSGVVLLQQWSAASEAAVACPVAKHNVNQHCDDSEIVSLRPAQPTSQH